MGYIDDDIKAMLRKSEDVVDLCYLHEIERQSDKKRKLTNIVSGAASGITSLSARCKEDLAHTWTN